MSELEPYDDGDGVIDGQVVDGEIVDETPPHPVRQAINVTVAVAQHRHTRMVWQNAAYIGLGVYVAASRMWQGRTTARYEKWIRSAEQSGDPELALAWETRLAHFRKDRHERRTDMVELPLKVFLALPRIAMGVLGIFVTIGVLLAIAAKNIREVVVPIEVAAKIVAIIALVFSVAWGPLLLALPWIAVITLWYVGRGWANGGATGWSRAGKNDGDDGIVVTADTIVLACRTCASRS